MGKQKGLGIDSAVRRPSDRELAQMEPGQSPFPQSVRANDPLTSWKGAAAVEPKRETQAAKILARLRLGPATNLELSQYALKYTGRISDLRTLGHRITATVREDGMTWYELGGQR